MKKNVVFLGVGLMALSGNVFADVSETFTHTTPTTAFGFTDNFTLTSFDTSLGTLTGITINFATTGTANVVVFNATHAPQSFTGASASIPLTLSGPAGVPNLQTTTADGPVAGTVPGVFFGQTTFPGVSTSSSVSEAVAAGLFSEFETVGPAALGFSAAAPTGTFGGSADVPGTLFFGGSGELSAITSVTYTYAAATVTPEPALFGVVSLCLGGLVLVRRKSLKKS